MVACKKPHGPAAKKCAAEETPPPAVLTGKDFKRAAVCTDHSLSRWMTSYIESSPVGLCATNGKMLCAINAPGWPYHCFLEAREVKRALDEAELAINGKVMFVSRKNGAEAQLTIAHNNPDEVNFPKWQTILPEAQALQPVATLKIALLKGLLTALQRDPESVVTVFARPDDCLSPVMLGNEAGDLGVLMPIGMSENDTPHSHFPEAIYKAFQRDTQTIPLAWIPRRPLHQQQPEGDAEAAASGAGGSAQEKTSGLLG